MLPTAMYADAEIDATLADLLDINIDEQTRNVVALPVKMGGLGIRAYTPVVGVAYEASRHRILQLPGAPPTDELAARACIDEQTQLFQETVTGWRKRSTESTSRYAGSWMHCLWVPWGAAATFSAALRYRLGIASRHVALHNHCSGCTKAFSRSEYEEHVVACPKRSGHNPTTKHNALRDFLHRLALQGGARSVKEPRHFTEWSCRLCKEKITADQRRQHDACCSGSLDRSGPDLEIELIGVDGTDLTTLYDVSVVHTTSPSNVSCDTSKLIAKRESDKNARYLDQAAAIGLRFSPLIVTSHGLLTNSVIRLLEVLSAAADRDREEVMAEFQVVLHGGNGASVRQAAPFKVRGLRR